MIANAAEQIVPVIDAFIDAHWTALTCARPELRTPEILGIRELPDYANLDEARRALGPRSIPSKEAIRTALIEAGGEEADDDDEWGGRRTGLARDPPEYFGMVG